MSDYEKLKDRLRITSYLVADAQSGRVELVGQVQAFEIMAEQGPFPIEAIIDARKALEHFSRLENVGKKDREFTLREIGKIAGMNYPLAYNYFQRGIFTPSARPFRGKGRGEDHEGRFSWSDAFIAGIVGSLRRNGLRPGILTKVPALLDEKKRTSRKVVTSDRS